MHFICFFSPFFYGLKDKFPFGFRIKMRKIYIYEIIIKKKKTGKTGTHTSSNEQRARSTSLRDGVRQRLDNDAIPACSHERRRILRRI
ncbi:unnamed protein product [Citrullus colocynthis]|uniref:Uncharacterized protein n=1 Tax=Citrullus colocynthis TaxID=252529 RepID=A0ABP0YQL3_9ROSI